MDVLQIKSKSGDVIIVRFLLAEGVEYIFGYPGGAIMPLYDVLHCHSEHIIHILTRHEQGAVHAAQGYARISGKIGVCISTSGPGATNFITGLADACIDNTSILCLCGQVASHLLGKCSFQETNIIDISFPITKWNSQILLSQDIGIILQKACYITNYGRNAPVLIDITKDAQMNKSSFIDSQYKVEFYKIDHYCPFARINAYPIEKSYELIKSSKKPLVLIGQGVVLAKAEDELKNFIEQIDCPVASTLLGLDIIDNNHPLFMGMLGMHGGYSTNLLINQCDVLIAIGMRFDDRVTGDVKRFARQAKIIHIDIDPCEIDKQFYCTTTIVENCKICLPFLTKKIRKTTKKVWIDLFYQTKKCEEKILIRDLYPKYNRLSMGEIIKYINMFKDKNAILVTDVGQHQMISSRYFFFSSRRSKVTSGGLGTMGYAVPAAIGAQFSNKNRQIICIVGDGGLQMTLQEFGTIMQYKLPIKIILINNNFLGMVKQWQDFFFKRRYAFTKLINPNFIQLAKSYEIESKKIIDKNSLEKEIKEMLEFNNTFFLEIIVDKEDNVLPMIYAESSVDEIRLK